jgi:hypothetical protein
MNYLFNINRQVNSGVSSQCSNGCPTDKYVSSVNLPQYKSSDVLYSIYNSYQNTFTPTYLATNIDYLTNPSNYSSSPPGPANIFIIRHGEKPTTGYPLSCNGISRACQLPGFVNSLGESGFPIFAIITCYPNMVVGSSNGSITTRPESTIMLSSFLLNIPLYMYSNSNISQPYDGQTALQIFTDPTFIGKNILVVWEHNNIQALSNQIVQCYNYLSAGNTTTDLINNSATVFSTEDTSAWWSSNTPIPPPYQYNYATIVPPLPAPPDTMPYTSYSSLLPYWNYNCYDLVYHFLQNNTNLTFNVLSENINTCFQNCNLLIGLLQYNESPSYSNEDNCETP